MELHQLHCFKKVAERQNITRAAEELHMSQPSLSRMIRNLENELGYALFDRNGKSISLNRSGRIVLEHTNEILRQEESIYAHLQSDSAEREKTIRISIYSASKLISRLVILFKEQYPEVKFNLVQAPIGLEDQDSYDLMLYSSILPETAENVLLLDEESIFLALSNEHPLANQHAVDLRQVAHEKFICVPKGRNFRTITDRYCAMAGFTPHVVMESDDPEGIKDFIAAGTGMCFFASRTWGSDMHPKVAVMPISMPVCKQYVCLKWKKGIPMSDATRRFCDFAVQYFSSMRHKY